MYILAVSHQCSLFDLLNCVHKISFFLLEGFFIKIHETAVARKICKTLEILCYMDSF